MIPYLVLDHRVYPAPVTRIRGRGVTTQATEEVDLHGLRQGRDLYSSGRTMPGVLEKRLHQLDVDLHPSLVCCGDHHFEDVTSTELGITAPVVCHERVGVIPGVRVEVGASAHLVGFRDSVIGPPVELVADRTTRLESQPTHRTQHQDVDPHPVLKGV